MHGYVYSKLTFLGTMPRTPPAISNDMFHQLQFKSTSPAMHLPPTPLGMDITS